MKNKSLLPFFSVVIPALNEEKYLPQLLDDLARQSFTDFEVIIVDAKSQDKTREKAEKFKDKFRIFQFMISNKKNVSHQRNLGAGRAKADWIIFFDADNRLPSGFLKEIRKHLKSKRSDILSSLIHADTKDISGFITENCVNRYIKLQKFLKQDYLLESFICVGSKVFKDLGGFDEKVQSGEGGEFLKRAYEKNYVYHLVEKPKYTYSFRRSRKEGLIKSFLKVALIEILRYADIKIPEKYQGIFYPMKGGKYYNKTS